MSSNELIEVLNSDGKNPFFMNQPYIFDPTNAFFDQNTMNNLQQEPIIQTYHQNNHCSLH